MYIAHIANIDGKRINQTCKDHMENTAAYAKENLEGIGLGTVAYLVGIMHDMGKLKKEFASYLEVAVAGGNVSRGSVNHSSAGCIWLLDQCNLTGTLEQKEYVEVLLSEMLGYVIASHHGLMNCLDQEGVSGLGRRKQASQEIYYKECLQNYYVEILDERALLAVRKKALDELNSILPHMKYDTEFQNGLLARLILSALVDADRRDTMEFMSQTKQNSPISAHADMQDLWDKQLKYFENQLGRLNMQGCMSDINMARKQISAQCFDKAKMPDGIYKLDVPTGSGKTLASLRYALTHAKIYNKKRIFFVIPLLSILEQNSKIIRKYIEDQDIILEHHSNVIMDKDGGESIERYELLTENWHSPIVITTMVQFLNTLFAGKMSSIRRMHALCDSIIVIDEVQSVPSKMISLFNIAINFLHTVCNCSIVLSSATQPAFANVAHPIQFSIESDMVKMNEDLYKPFIRSRVISRVEPEGYTISDLADFTLEVLSTRSSVLVICNTKSTALRLMQQIDLYVDKEKVQVLHISASMCQQHRLDIMEQMNATLQHPNGPKLICVSTQVIEAGVDVSFESVIRVLAGIDNIAQAAGRCNRNADYEKLCDVYIVKLNQAEENLKLLKDIKEAQDVTLNLLYQFQCHPELFENDILSHESIDWFYRKLFNEVEVNKHDYYVSGIQDTLYHLLSANPYRYEHNMTATDIWHNCIMKQSFKDAGELFRVFDDNTIDVIVPYNEEAEEIICDLNTKQCRYDILFLNDLVQRAKRYSVRIFGYQQKTLEDIGMLHSYFDGTIYSLDPQCYNPKWGFDIDFNTIF